MPPTAASAATVALCRDSAAGVEVYLQRRPRRMRFAAGLWVFPGGRVDDADRDPAIDAHWSGPPPSAWAARLGVTPEQARGYVVAACRETFEEAGVMLSAAPVPDDAATPARHALLAGQRSFAATLADLDATIDTALLRYWAWWVTPETEPLRYDTRFFTARVPAHARVSPHRAEVVDEAWMSAPAEGSMLAPTLHTLRSLVALGSTDAVMAAGSDREVARVLPHVDGDDVVLPWNEHIPRPRA